MNTETEGEKTQANGPRVGAKLKSLKIGDMALLPVPALIVKTFGRSHPANTQESSSQPERLV
jgi:hypothetical protein